MADVRPVLDDLLRACKEVCEAADAAIASAPDLVALVEDWLIRARTAPVATGSTYVQCACELMVAAGIDPTDHGVERGASGWALAARRGDLTLTDVDAAFASLPKTGSTGPEVMVLTEREAAALSWVAP